MVTCNLGFESAENFLLEWKRLHTVILLLGFMLYLWIQLIWRWIDSDGLNDGTGLLAKMKSSIK